MINCLPISILKSFVTSGGLKIDDQNIYYFESATICNGKLLVIVKQL